MGGDRPERGATAALGRREYQELWQVQTLTLRQAWKGTNQGSWPHCRSKGYGASTTFCDDPKSVAAATLVTVRSNPLQDERLRKRLQEAVDHFAGGSADLFGRKLGYTNGGYIRELLRGPKPVRGAVIERMDAVEGMGGWFDDVVAPVTARDLAEARRPSTAGAGLAESLAAALCALDDEALAQARQALATLAASPDSQRAARALTRALDATAQADLQVSPAKTGT